MTRVQPPAMAASATHEIMGLPKILCETLAWFDFMRVPSPAARMMAVAFAMDASVGVVSQQKAMITQGCGAPEGWGGRGPAALVRGVVLGHVMEAGTPPLSWQQKASASLGY